jgi:hypothetical protein
LTQPQITELTKALLDEKEIAVADRLDFLIEKEPEMWKAWALLEQVLPIFWIVEGKYLHTRAPVFVYRALYYLNHPHDFVNNSRKMILMMGNHLEGLLVHLLDLHNRPLGDLSYYLSKANQTGLSSSLLKFNEVYRRAKHMSGDSFLPTRLDQRTFSTREAVYCLFVMAQSGASINHNISWRPKTSSSRLPSENASKLGPPGLIPKWVQVPRLSYQN